MCGHICDFFVLVLFFSSVEFCVLLKSKYHRIRLKVPCADEKVLSKCVCVCVRACVRACALTGIALLGVSYVFNGSIIVKTVLTMRNEHTQILRML